MNLRISQHRVKPPEKNYAAAPPPHPLSSPTTSYYNLSQFPSGDLKNAANIQSGSVRLRLLLPLEQQRLHYRMPRRGRDGPSAAPGIHRRRLNQLRVTP